MAENWDDKEFVLTQIEEGYSLQYASDQLKDDKELVLMVVLENGYELKYVSDRLKNDRDVVFAALHGCGNALEYVSEKLKNDFDVVTSAVSQSGYALQFASDRMKDNRKAVINAVSENWFALEYASEHLRSDVDFAFHCAKISPNSVFSVLGEAEKLFIKYHYDIQAIQAFLQQEKDNKIFLAKLTEHSLMLQNTNNNLFKRQLL